MKEVTKVAAGLGTFKLGPLEFEWAMVVKIIVIIFVAIVASAIVRALINRFIRTSSQVLKVDTTRLKFMRNALTAIIWTMAVIGIIHAIPPLRTLSMTLLAGAGIFAAVLGFASQQAFSNIISGIFVVLSRPFRVGDVIRVGRDTGPGNDITGTVEDITLRHTIIRDFQNRRIVIPNSLINAEVITNSDIVDERVRRHCHFVISYDSNLDRAIEILQEEVRKHPYFLDGRSPQEILKGEPDVQVRIVEFNDNGIRLRAYTWARNFDESWDLQTDLNKAVFDRFRAEGIEFPYATHTVYLKNRE
jgi:small-conductance mechanosensitive channel